MFSLNSVKLGQKFKSLIKLKVNILLNLKILRFKKKKWKNFLYFFKNQFKLTKFNKYKIIDQKIKFINKRDVLEFNYKNKNFKKKFMFSKFFNLFFGNFSKAYYYNLKKKIKKSCNNIKTFIIQHLESRLDLVLFRSKFFVTIKFARQCINRGHVSVNSKKIKKNAFLLKSGDLISFNLLSFNSLNLNFTNKLIWPIVLDYLIINYKTMEIVFLGNFLKVTNFIFYSFFNLKLHKFLKF